MNFARRPLAIAMYWDSGIFSARTRVAARRRPARILNDRSRMRNFMFTIFNVTDEMKTRFQGWRNNKPERIRFATAQLERCPTSGRIHLQGYCEMQRQTALRVIRDDIFQIPAWNVEDRLGTAAEAAAYCRKEDTRVPQDEEHGGWCFDCGEISNQGRAGQQRRTVADAVATKIQEGSTPNEIEESHPGFFMMNAQRVNDYFIKGQGKRHLEPSRTNVYIYYGASGMGKTTSANMTFPEAHHQLPETKGGRWWWPDYRGQEVVIIDEFRQKLPYQTMLKLLDIHPMTIEYKGGNCQMVSKKIIITTIQHPSKWYPGVKDKTELERRIKENSTIFRFTGPVNMNGRDILEKFPRVAENMDEFRMDPYEGDGGFNFSNGSNDNSYGHM